MKKLFFGIIFLSAASFISFSQNPGDATFFSPNIHTVKIYFSQIGWWDSLVMYKPLDKKMLGDVDIDGIYINSVGIQFKGNSSFSKDSLKNSFKIDFNEFVSGQKYDGLKVINLNNGVSDPTMMREKIFLDFCLAVDIEAPRATYTNLYINDTLWGFYTLVEQVNKTFLQNEYGNDGGNLFKGDPNGTLEWFGSSPSLYYTKYELKTNETANDWTDLIHLIDKINNTPSVNFYDSLENVLNTTSWIEAWAANN
ncbi:MAG: CotH kinase family protein, partial [Bacteroidales bacterium]